MQRLILINTVNELNELKRELKDAEFVAYDTETTGVDKDSKIIGFSVCADPETAYYVVLGRWVPEEQKLSWNQELWAWICSFFHFLKSKKLIMHNAIFDCWMTYNNFKIDLLPSLHTDTMILGHILDENRSNGLKELGTAIFGEDAREEQLEMQASVTKNGGRLDKKCYELYKGDPELIGKYGAKDAMLTLNLFYHFLPELYEQKLDEFFYEKESMPLLKTATYDLNTVGLRVDVNKLKELQLTLIAEMEESKGYIDKEVWKHIKDKYPGTNKKNTFNIGSSQQLVWLLFFQLKNEFHLLTTAGKELCRCMKWNLPYTAAAKREFIENVKAHKGQIYKKAGWNFKTKKREKDKKVQDPLKYISCGKETLAKFSTKYKWVAEYVKYAKNKKILTTYVEGIQEKMQYGIIRPSFLQHGTTSGRYSSKKPNFQNLPRDDKRVKACIISRPGKVFVGADYSQLEPRIFASQSGDKRLLECFKKGDDFYSVIGIELEDRYDCVPLKEGPPNAYGIVSPEGRTVSKVVALSATYGTTAPKMAPLIKKSIQEAQDTIDQYFEKFPDVLRFMKSSHQEAKEHGVVYNLYGRPRRMKKAKDIIKIYGNVQHSDLPYEYRNLLNLAVNHKVQSSGASIVNRAAIKLHEEIRKIDPEATIVLQVHDSLIAECRKEYAKQIAAVMQSCMENTTELPGVKLEAIPKIGTNLAEV